MISFSAFGKTYSIGVLAYNGKQQALNRWQPTADFLSKKITDSKFRIVPLSLDEGINAINKQEIDFILTNPGHYVRLEVNFGVTRIATFLNRYQDQTLKYFSVAIFTRQDTGIKNLKDLKGRTFAAVSEDAFGGFQLAQLALLDNGIHALEDLDIKWLGFPHADIVRAVIEGRADAGIVRSGVMEKMAAAKKLDISDIRVLDKKDGDGYPFLHSVGFYPEWPFAKLPHTDTRLSKAVAISLLKMNETDEAAIRAGGSGWTIPLAYSSIHDVLQLLQVEPYPPTPLVMADFWEAYQKWILVMGLLFLVTFSVLVRLSRINNLLKNTQNQLQNHQAELEEIVQQRTDELLQINETLQVQIATHIQTEQTLRDGCESLKSLYSVITRSDLDREQKLTSMVDSIRHYLGSEFAALTNVDEGEFSASVLSPANSKISIPLSNEYSMAAIQELQIVSRENTEQWHSYICCPIFIQGELRYLLELASSKKAQTAPDNDNNRHGSELSKNILSLVSQWVGNEYSLLEDEKHSQIQNEPIRQRFECLSPRENEVLELLIHGESTKSMARTLKISTKTVEMHRASLLRKTAAKSSTELVQLAVNSGIFDLT